jgi:predicted double-glycine peptidase
MLLFIENDPGIPAGKIEDPFAGLDVQLAGALREAIDFDGVPVLAVPITSQETSYSCGAAALLGVLRFWNVYEGREKALYAPLETSRADGTSPQKLVDVARSFGLAAEYRMGLSFDDLRDALKRGVTAIVYLQAWSGMNVHRDSCEAGHYVVLVGMDSANAYFMDPASHLTTYAYMPLERLELAWYGQDGPGQRYERSAVFIRGSGGWDSVELDTATLMEAKAIGTAQMYGQVSMRDMVMRDQGAFTTTLRSRIKQSSTNAVRALAPVVESTEGEILAVLFEWFDGRITYHDAQVETARVWRRAYEKVREVGRRASAVERHGAAVDARLVQEEEKWFRSAVREELTYWNTFLHEINEDQVSEDRLIERLTDYLKAMRFMYESARIIALPDSVLLYWMGPRDERNCGGCEYMLERSPFTKGNIPAVPRDGSTPCLVNCRHKIVVRVAENRADVQRREQVLESRRSMVSALNRIKHADHGHHRKRYVRDVSARAHPHARNPFHNAPSLPSRTEPFEL